MPLIDRKNETITICFRYSYFISVLVSGVSTKDFMAKLGEYLILTAFSHNCRLERAFKCLGTDLTEFLTTLDSVHDVLHDQVKTTFYINIQLKIKRKYIQ